MESALRDELERYYKDSPREYLPLSQQEEFKAIKNMVIREAERLRLGTFTFEDVSVRDEADEDQDAVCFAWNSSWRMAEVYQSAKEVLEEYENPEGGKSGAGAGAGTALAEGFPLAAYQLGKCHRVRPAGQPVCPVRSWKTVPHWAGCQTGSGSRPGRISMNRQNRETSTPPSSWSTSTGCAGPMCSWRPPGCSTTWARSFVTTRYRPPPGGTAGGPKAAAENPGKEDRHGPQAG